MAEYINREDLIAAGKNTHYVVSANDHPYDVAARVGKYFRRCVDEAPAADVVEVVRCKDCVFCVRKENGYVKCGNTYGMLIVAENEYCSRGKRRRTDGRKQD